MEAKVLQLIFDHFFQYFSKKWVRIALYCSFVDDIVNPKLFIDIGKGYIDCYQTQYKTQELLHLFFEIEEILSHERKKLSNINRWNVFTMTIDNNGTINADYDYSNISDSFMEHQFNWIKSHIRIK